MRAMQMGAMGAPDAVSGSASVGMPDAVGPSGVAVLAYDSGH